MELYRNFTTSSLNFCKSLIEHSELYLPNADLVYSVTSPAPGGSGGSPQTTTTVYDSMMRPTSVTQPDGTTVNTVYLLTGELGLQYGSRIYPEARSYDYAGRMQTMTNWSSFNINSPAGGRVTTWNYDGGRGWLNNKQYPDNTGPSYQYTAAGRLKKRTWVRTVGGQPLTTTYNFDTAGSLTNIAYSDSTPSVTNRYDRLGRLSSVVCGGMTDTMTYNLANELLSETFTGGSLAGLAITNTYDTNLRRTGLAILNSQSSILASANYAYDSASRLKTVTDANNNSATYNYLANSPLVSQITFKQNGTTRMTTTKQYDFLNRLTSISSLGGTSSTSPINFNYSYNSANQRTRNVLADGSYWAYQYDSLGQVTNSVKHFADGSLVPGQQFGYGFDDIGNRQQTTSGGDAAGNSLRLANYTNNALNQITQRDVPGYVDINGVSLVANTVTVNGTNVYRKGEYFRRELGVTNTTSPLWTNITVVATGQANASVAGNVFVPKTPEQLSYDLDGNRINDGRFSYSWDGENRLIGITNSTGVGLRYNLNCAYDSQSRRLQKIVATNGVGIYTNKFIYDGWNLVAILDATNGLDRTFQWGTDLSGSAQGAGGVCGLISMTIWRGTNAGTYFYAYDGNGNVAALINASN